ncbi:MAG TPA: tetratricopeptide repeat protein [Candidatus Angelobacter sp.]|nr:tetratricopeptide repeat protein [Candidatus Angelobacter sp.]
MKFGSSQFRTFQFGASGPRTLGFATWVLAGMALLAQPALAQRGSTGSSNTSSRTTSPSRTPTSPDTSSQPVFISGKVMLEGGGSLLEPVAIERICGGVTRREGYSDSKGQFELQLGLNIGFQDASENDSRITPGTVSRPGGTSNRRPMDLTGCEFRAVLAGYQSSTAILRTNGDNWQFDIGTIFLKRMGDAKGTTISITSMAAPKDAMRAYEKAQRVKAEKPAEAEKDLNKAVQIYPQFAAAWTLLGDLHRQHDQFEDARNEYTRAISADPQFVNPAYGLAMIAMQQKKWDEAVQFTEQVVKLNAFAFPLAYFFNAAANYNLQKFDAAEESGKKFKAMDNQHSHPDVSLLLSYVYSRKQDYAGAAKEIRDYLAAEPNSPNAEALKTEAKRFEDLSVSAKKD